MQLWNNALESGHTAKMIKLILIIKTFIFYEQRNKKIKEVNKTEPREIIQVWNKKKFAGFYIEVNPVLAALDSFQFYFFFSLKDTSKSRCKLRMAPF